MIVFAFDRDLTVDVNKGPIPLAWVRWLASTANEVWAVGNQRLKAEAGIPGVEEMRIRLGIPKKAARTRARRTRYVSSKRLKFLAQMAAIPEPDKRTWNVNSKIKRLKMLAQIFPDAELRIVVDDYDLSHAGGWKYYTPAEFVAVWGPRIKEALPFVAIGGAR